MKRIEQRLLIFLFLAFYLTPTLELDAKESKANYANECHQYLNSRDEQNSIIVKAINQSFRQESGLFYSCDFSFHSSVSTWVPHEDLSGPQKIFLLHSILII